MGERMISLMTQVGIRTLLLGLGCLLAAAGCKNKPAEGEANAPGSATGAAATGAPAEGGPCGTYAAKVCGAAGEQSGTCQATKLAVSVMPANACTAALKEFAFTEGQLKNQRKGCEEFLAKLCKAEGEASESCSFVKERIATIPTERCTEMLANFEQVLAQVKGEIKKNAPIDAALQAKLTSGNVPSFGPADAKVTLVEFSDFECPYCSKAAEVTSQIKQKYGKQVRFVFRQFPLNFHKNAQKAAEASLEAHAQGKFWEFHDLLFKNQRQLEEASLADYAKQAGLNVAAVKAALESSKHEAQVKADLKLGEEVFVQGTPSLFINGKRVPNPTDFAAVSSMLDAAIKEAG
jgi:protein-disulfide isomerase